eukprot:4660759-Pleurochrysis_carterae.AAC.1
MLREVTIDGKPQQHDVRLPPTGQRPQRTVRISVLPVDCQRLIIRLESAAAAGSLFLSNCWAIGLPPILRYIRALG